MSEAESPIANTFVRVNRQAPRFSIMRAPWGIGTEIRFFQRVEDRIAIASSVQMTMYDTEHVIEPAPSPMLTLHEHEDQAALQSLMDELWRYGVRPSDIGTPGHLAATQAHLKDMRALVSKTLDVAL